MRATPLAIGGVLSLTLLTVACSSAGTSSTTASPTATSARSSATTSNPTQPTLTGIAASPTVATTSTASGQPTQPTPAAASPTSSAPAVGAVDPNAPEVVEPGDIPDNQVFVEAPAADGSYTIEVPEGWARSEQNGIVTFTDKYNSVSVRSHPSAAPPTIDSVTADGLADVTTDPTFSITDVAAVTRTAGTGVVATYQIGSAPNTVTGKKALLAVERYFFAHNGIIVELTLAGAKGADNVDPWKIVSDSLRWT
jgi:hypothetical protein